MSSILKLTLAHALSLIACTSVGKSKREEVGTSKALSWPTDPMYSQRLRREDRVTVPRPSALLPGGGLCSFPSAREKVLLRGAM